MPLKFNYLVLIMVFATLLFAKRYYDPEISRWTSPDPIKATFGSYTYGENSPVRFTDPTGLLSSDEVQKITGGTGTTNVDANLLILAKYTSGQGNSDITKGDDLRAGLGKAGIKGESILPLTNIKDIVTSNKGVVTINFLKEFKTEVKGIGYLKLDQSMVIKASGGNKFSVETGMSAKPFKLSPWLGVTSLQLQNASNGHNLNVETSTGISRNVILPK